MSKEQEAMRAVQNVYPQSKVVEAFRFKDLYLVRVQHPDPDESDFDPFMSYNPSTGRVSEFAIGDDGDPGEVAAAYESRGAT